MRERGRYIFESGAKVGDADARVRAELLLPNPACDPKLELFAVSPREEESHVSLYDQPIMTIPDFPMTISNAPWRSLPQQLPVIPTNLEAIAIIPSLILIPHEPKESHVNWRHPQLKRLKVQAKVLPEAMEHLSPKKLLRSEFGQDQSQQTKRSKSI